MIHLNAVKSYTTVIGLVIFYLGTGASESENKMLL